MSTSTTSDSSLGAKIKILRKLLKLSQAQLSDLIGISRSYIGDIEAGRSSPSRHVLTSILEKIDVNSDWLFHDVGPVRRSNRQEPEPTPSKVVAFGDIRKEQIKRWLDDFWDAATEEERAWLRVQLQMTVPPFAEWIKKNEGGDQDRDTKPGMVGR